MARRCKITGKTRLVGNNVSHSKRRTKRVQLANLQYKKFWLPVQKRWIRIRVSTAAIRTIAKNGIERMLHDTGILKTKNNKKKIIDKKQEDKVDAKQVTAKKTVSKKSAAKKTKSVAKG